MVLGARKVYKDRTHSQLSLSPLDNLAINARHEMLVGSLRVELTVVSCRSITASKPWFRPISRDDASPRLGRRSHRPLRHRSVLDHGVTGAVIHL